MKKIALLAIIGVLVVIAVLVSLFYTGNEDSWLCQNSEWVMHGQPSADKPLTICDGNINTGLLPVELVINEIKITAPSQDSEIISPLIINGEAKGNWFFEGSFPIELRDNNNKMIASAIATANGEWMSNDFVPFSASLIFATNEAMPAKLIFKNDNPSGDSSLDKKVEIPIKLSTNENYNIKIFVGKTPESGDDCSKTFALERSIPATAKVGEAAINQLLIGLTAEEKNAGYFVALKEGTALQSLKVENTVAYADFNALLDYEVGGSCWTSQIIASISDTLKQFPTVKTVIISKNGETEKILQP